MLRKSGVAILAVGLLFFASMVAAQGITLDVTPSSQTIGIGEPVQVQLTVSGLGELAPPSLGTFDIDVTFDPAILAFSSAVFGDQLNLRGLGSITQSAPGTAKVNLFELSFDNPETLDTVQSGTFVLASITLDAVAPGTSPLDLAVNALGQAQGVPLETVLQGGTIQVSDSGGPPPATCTEQFGSASEFILCEETETACSFNVLANGSTCEQICGGFGSDCVGAVDNKGLSCMAIPGSSDTCQTPRQTEICICERSDG